MKANTSVYGKALYNAVVNLMKKKADINRRLFIEHIDICREKSYNGYWQISQQDNILCCCEIFM